MPQTTQTKQRRWKMLSLARITSSSGVMRSEQPRHFFMYNLQNEHKHNIAAKNLSPRWKHIGRKGARWGYCCGNRRGRARVHPPFGNKAATRAICFLHIGGTLFASAYTKCTRNNIQVYNQLKYKRWFSATLGDAFSELGDAKDAISSETRRDINPNRSNASLSAERCAQYSEIRPPPTVRRVAGPVFLIRSVL